ncbi:hypothetical protein D019_3237 [Vibrio parahaemolyticus VP2007-095]|nr:hypothetical protein D019_3237 [Vibrio parahaemolyticus VP2007-095]
MVDLNRRFQVSNDLIYDRVHQEEDKCPPFCLLLHPNMGVFQTK